jgi:hypothetical protein
MRQVLDWTKATTRTCYSLFCNKAGPYKYNEHYDNAWDARKIYDTQGTITSYQSDIHDEEWAFCARYLTLVKENAPQREYTMRAMFNAVRYMVGGNCFR